ncbi:MAG: resolvase, partial [Eubacteriales bacterium]|nr:resolvase [Eubacteriales bacterium]
LIENKDLELLKKIFDFFEDVVRGDDLHLKNILTITVLEMLGNDIKILEIAKKYMGPQTTLLQKKADKDLGRR